MEDSLGSHTDYQTLETGNIYFFYRTGIRNEVQNNPEAVQHFYLVLKPLERAKFRILSMVRRTHGNTPDFSQPIWGAVEGIDYLQLDPDNPWQQALLFPEDNQPLNLPDALPVARGRYSIIKMKDVHHLLYNVDDENQALSFTEKFRFPTHGCYAIQIKNPDKKMTVTMLPDTSRKVKFPRHLQEQFRNRPFVSKEAHECLDYAGAEFLMIATTRSLPVHTYLVNV